MEQLRFLPERDNYLNLLIFIHVNSYTALAASLTGRKLENDFGVNEASQPKQGLFNPSLLSVHDLLLVEGKNLSPWFQPLLHKTSIFYLG